MHRMLLLIQMVMKLIMAVLCSAIHTDNNEVCRGVVCRDDCGVVHICDDGVIPTSDNCGVVHIRDD